MTRIRLAIIAAVAENGVIGIGGGMPWRLSSDLKRFRELTLGKPVIMGRKTFETIGKPLAGRTNIVVSGRPGYEPDGVTVAPTLEAAFDLAGETARASSADEIMVIGGGEIYAAAIDRAETLYITHVRARPEGDTRFPPIDPSVWQTVSSEPVPAGEKDSVATEFVVYSRRR